jgi:phenylacetate-coenzyme A ligase PaaK-like adenylate-forming protein
MKNIGMMKALKLCRDYQKLDIGHREALRRQRLEEVVHWAKEMSPYYARLYKEIADDFTLTDLPAVNKRNLMANWDEWITDRRLTLTDVNSFMENLDNVGRKLNDKYLVFTTSGSSGNPLVCLCDKTTNNIMGAVNALRAFARKEDLKAFIARKGKTMGVFATGGFYLSNSSVRARLLAMPWKKRQIAVTSALLPITEVVKQLNDFQPAMLGGYPSHLELLIDEAKSGRLHISPLIIMTGGEYLSETLRVNLADTFGCYVQTSYSCTEGGSIACECREKHFHINDDWVIVEPVDKDNRPVPDGVQSDKILLTNLYNYTQPFIRYEITDRVILHREPCKCGNSSPWLELEGRMDDVASFTQNGREIRVAPLAIYAILKEVHELRRFQLIVKPENHAELRFESIEGVSREAAFQKAEKALRAFLLTQDVTSFSLALSSDMPRQMLGSGKYKHIINNT